MSERFARACAKKRHYRSERRSVDAAKRTQRMTGIEMRAYRCPYCKGQWCVGTLYPQQSRTERRRAAETTLKATEKPETSPRGCY